MPIEKLLFDETPLPPLNALRAFEAAGRHLNFRIAAEHLGVSQGAVAQQVRGLEAQLGQRLFERRHKTLAFTDAGRAYHEQVSRAFTLLRSATATLKPAPAKVTISVTPSFASRWLIPNLADFTNAHPDIELLILATENISSFHSEGIDLAVRQGRPPFGASLDAELLFHQEVVAVCAPALLAGKRQPLDAEALAGLVLLHDAHNLWPAFLKEVAGWTGAPPERGLRFNQTSLSIDAALAGQGVSLASRFLVAAELASGRLVQAFPGVLAGERDFYLLTRRSAQRPAAVSAAWQWLTSRRDENEKQPISLNA